MEGEGGEGGRWEGEDSGEAADRVTFRRGVVCWMENCLVWC